MKAKLKTLLIFLVSLLSVIQLFGCASPALQNATEASDAPTQSPELPTEPVEPTDSTQYESVRIGIGDIILSQGGVNSTNGTLNTSITNNWYTDIKIPKGAKKVTFLCFKTAGAWGSAFFEGTTYISGYSNKREGGQWITLDIPQNATVFRYGYVYDTVAQKNGLPKFEYLEFSGESVQYEKDPIAKPQQGVVMKHTFTVEVDIAPALGKDTPVLADDYGYIMLPKNYTKDGEATRLIIVCHGAGASLSSYQSTVVESFSQTYWLDMGYAIMDMYACPPALGDGSELHYGNPTVLECYEKGYEYVMEHFNLKTDGVFVVGSSMGGLSSFQIVQSGKFPVLAQVANCPVIDLFKQAYCNPWASTTYQRDRIADYFGFDGIKPTFTETKHTLSATEVNYFKDNFDKITPYSPIFATITAGDAINTLDTLPANATATDATEAALYEQLTATHPCPLLIIHNKNDGTVSYRYSEYFANMLERGGANVTLKLYDTGGHGAWDNGPIGSIKDYNGKTVNLKESKRLAIEFFREYEK